MIGVYLAHFRAFTQLIWGFHEDRTQLSRNVSNILTNNTDNRSFLDIGKMYKTDKVTDHHYEILYEKYLKKYVGSAVHLLEIGLGCGMSYGPGASAHLWRSYLGPLANIHFLEYNKECGETWYKSQGQQVKALKQSTHKYSSPM
jgi:hypothetical protein